jgi:hypothetical protein
MKLKQIDFNADLICQDGIVVKTMDGKDVKQLTFFKCASMFPLYGIVDDVLCLWATDGKYGLNKISSHYDLIMYKQVKVMTVDEFYDEWYNSEDDSVLSFAHKLAAAIKAGEVEA